MQPELSEWPPKVVALHQGATRVPRKKFSSQNHDLAFAAHISDHRLTALIHMHMLDAEGLRAAVPQAT
jgi:hypothetical protein